MAYALKKISKIIVNMGAERKYMTYNPEVHHRHSIRLKEYDYSKEGMYFITICTKDRECIFGNVINGKNILNEYGKMVEEEIIKTKTLRKEIEINEYVIMPNHVHIIIETTNVGAYGIRPKENIENNNQGVHRTPLQSPSKTIGAAVRGLKCAISRNIGCSIWQRNYYEHIIRNEKELYKIIDYMEYNPMNWENDNNYKE